MLTWPTVRPYLFAILLVGFATLVGEPLRGILNPTNKVMLYLAAVVTTAYFWGRGPSNLAAVLSVLAFNVFFVPPTFTFAVQDWEYLITFLGLLLTGLLVSQLTAIAKQQAISAQAREEDALTLLALSRDLAKAETEEELLTTAGQHLDRRFGEIRISLKGKGEQLPEKESSYQWHKLKGPTQELGQVGLTQPTSPRDQRRSQLLEAILNQVSAALERRAFSEKAQQTELLEASEELHRALLNSISHDLRIPLVSIRGALTSLEDRDINLSDEARHSLLANALSETDRLNRLVGNLLQMTRLESGHLTVKAIPCDLEDLIVTTLASLHDHLLGREVEVTLPPELPLVLADYVLIQQVLTNLLENAHKYSPAGQPVEIATRLLGDGIEVEILDCGDPLDEEHQACLFQRFQRGRTDHPGTGLGLSIAKGLVEAHGGQAGYRRSKDHRNGFFFTLSKAEEV